MNASSTSPPPVASVRYLVDSDCFIQSKNLWYGFDFCPGFWDWLDRQNAAGVIFGIDAVRTELRRGNDDLAKWATARGAGFFLPPDQATVSMYKDIIAWASGANFTPNAILEFSGAADGWLVAHAAAHGFAVASHERLDLNRKSRISVPRVCHEFSVPHLSLYDVLRNTGIKLVI